MGFASKLPALRRRDGGLLRRASSRPPVRDQGHEVRLMSPEYVRPYVKAQKNDDRDAEAIAEAATRPTMRFVALKSEEQLDMQTLHRARDRLVGGTDGADQPAARRSCSSVGSSFQGPAQARAGSSRPCSPRTAGAESTDALLLVGHARGVAELDRRIAAFDDEFAACASERDAARLATIPGVGVMIATALVAAVGDARELSRTAATWRLGSASCRGRSTTGGKPQLLGISKRGNSYLRKMLIHGARAALPRLAQTRHAARALGAGLLARAHKNVVVVALANKLARIAWAVLRRGEASLAPQPRVRGGMRNLVGRRADDADRPTMSAGGGSEMA